MKCEPTLPARYPTPRGTCFRRPAGFRNSLAQSWRPLVLRRDLYATVGHHCSSWDLHAVRRLLDRPAGFRVSLAQTVAVPLVPRCFWPAQACSAFWTLRPSLDPRCLA